LAPRVPTTPATVTHVTSPTGIPCAVEVITMGVVLLALEIATPPGEVSEPRRSCVP
jgi:hypothetical protein